jgi:hypothetical protein
MLKSLEARALLKVVVLVVTAIVVGIGTVLSLEFLGLQTVLLSLAVFVLVYLLRMVYVIELDRLRREHSKD